MSKQLEFGHSARDKMMAGISDLARAVKATMGPRGRNAVIQRKGQTPHVTKDGVTVAKSISFKDAYKESGALLVKQVAQKTADVAGDGPQPLWSKILTPTGFITHAEVKVGMTICGTNGSFQTVTGVFPKGEKEIVEVILSDGRVVECCEDHLWTVVSESGEMQSLTTKELLPQIDSWSIPATLIELKQEKELEFDPYMIARVIESSNKEELMNLVGPAKIGEYLGLLEGRIPQAYLWSSIKNRQKLFFGILEASGDCPKRVSAADFAQLVWSIGSNIQCRIADIRYTGKKAQMQCIKVSNPDHLYITDNFVVTHNTTTSTVLAEAIMREGNKLIAAGHDPMSLKRGMDKACDFVVNYIKSESRQVETEAEVCQVGTISANGDAEIGKLVSDAIARVGKSGIITLEESSSAETVLRVGSGYEFDRGYLTVYFCNDLQKQRVIFRDADILLVEGNLVGTQMLKDLIPLLEYSSNNARNLVIIAENIEGEILSTLATNAVKKSLNVVAIKAPGYGAVRSEMLKDIAALVGATVLDEPFPNQLSALNNDGMLNLNVLGFAPSVEVYQERTILISNPESAHLVEERVELLRTQLEQTTDTHEREILERRLAKMVGGLATIEVGAATEAEMKEKKDRLEDALAATRAAIQEGIVAGGGVVLARASAALDAFSTGNSEEDVGKDIIAEAIRVPLWQIAANAGEKGDVVVSTVMTAEDKTHGFDAAKLRYTDMFSAGIIDPAKVTRVALQNAVSIAGLVLTTEVVVALEDEK